MQGMISVDSSKVAVGLFGTKLRALLRLLEAERLLGPEAGPRPSGR